MDNLRLMKTGARSGRPMNYQDAYTVLSTALDFDVREAAALLFSELGAVQQALAVERQTVAALKSRLAVDGGQG